MRNSRLDFLRFIGVALTMCNHLTHTGNMLPERILGKLCMGGWIGVDIFFVLSGFLVSGLIFKEYDRYQSFHPGHFLIRRGFKIYPTYYVFLALSFSAALIFKDVFPTPSKHALLYEAIFVSNYFTHNNGMLWSICVEEHFYLFLSLLFFILIKFRKLNFSYILGTYLVLFAGTFFFRYQNYLHHTTYEFFQDYTKTHFRVDALFFGVVLFYIYDYRKEQLARFLKSKLNYLLLVISVLFIASDFILYRDTHRWMAVINLGLHPWFFGCIMINFLEYKSELINKLIRPFAWVGMYSYSIYLFHGRIEAATYHFFSGYWHDYMYYIAFFTLSIAVGVLMSKAIEYPVLRLRDKYFPSRSKGGLVPAENK